MENIMRPIALEAAIVTEHENGYATLALNNDLLDGLEKEEQERVIKSLLLLARQKLASEIVQCPKGKQITQSVDTSHKDFVMQLKLLVSPSGKFSLLTYFGGAAEPSTPLRRGLHHAVEVIGAVEARGF
jgi:hypothetical protein